MFETKSLPSASATDASRRVHTYLPRHNAIENFPTHPALNTSSIKLPLEHLCFLRTYSARIYFIVSNSSLACLHMPHPSNPVDDNSVRPYNREHDCLPKAVSRTFGSLMARCFAVLTCACQRVECQSDGLPLGCSSCVLLCSVLQQYILLPATSFVCSGEFQAKKR